MAQLLKRKETMVTTQKWINVDKGIRYREHAERKHGKKFDRYFVLRFTADGKMRQEALGWASDGVTLEKARIELAKLKEANRTGEGARTLSERRHLQELQQKKRLENERNEQNSIITFESYWKQTYFPAQAHKAEGSRVAEAGLWSKWLQAVIGDIPVCLLKAANLEIVKANMLRAKKSPATIKYAMSVVSQIWTMAVRDGIIEGICPTRSVSLPKKDNRRQRFLTKEEARTLLNALTQRSTISHDMAIFSLDCGLRFGEIAALTWKDADFEKGQLLIRDPKACSNRYAFMTRRIKAILENRNSQGAAGLIFLDRNGNRIDRISNAFRRVADELFNKGVDDERQRVCFHTLRHTFASWLVSGGVSLYEVKELMGHADFEMTQRYSHLSPEGLRAAVKILEEDM